MQTFAVIFALCGLFVHGEPPSVLMFVLDLYSWLGPRVLAFLYLWQPVLLHLRSPACSYSHCSESVTSSSTMILWISGVDAPDYGTSQPVCLWVSGHGQGSQRALVSGRDSGCHHSQQQNNRMKTTSQTSECTRNFLGAKHMQNTYFARTFAIVFATRNERENHCERSLCKTSLISDIWSSACMDTAWILWPVNDSPDCALWPVSYSPDCTLWTVR